MSSLVRGRIFVYPFLIILDIAIFFFIYGVGTANIIDDASNIGVVQILYSSLCMIGGLFILKNIERIKFYNSVILCVFLYLVYYLIRMCIFDYEVSAKVVFSQCIWEILFIIGYSFSNIQLSNRAIIKLAKLEVFVLISIYIVATILLIPLYNNFLLQPKDMYFSLFFIVPFLLLLPSGKPKYISCALIELLALISIKRSIIIIITMIITIVLYREIKKLRVGKIIFFAIIIFILLFIVYSQNEVLADISNRMSSISEDGGSGRFNMWNILWKNYINSDAYGIIFGLGYFSVSEIISIAAHNDILQILLNSGLVGVTLYVLIYYRIFITGLRCIKLNNRRLGSGIILTLICLILLSNTNCFIIFPPFISPFMFFLGFIIGLSKKRLIAK